MAMHHNIAIYIDYCNTSVYCSYKDQYGKSKADMAMGFRATLDSSVRALKDNYLEMVLLAKVWW